MAYLLMHDHDERDERVLSGTFLVFGGAIVTVVYILEWIIGG